MKLSIPEQRLLAFAHEQFGERLSQFLLSGLGKEKVGQRWRFTITYVEGEGTTLKRLLEVITYEPPNGSTYLPRRRDPLILLAFLKLLRGGDHAAPNNLLYKHKDVLSILGWKDTQKAHREIDKAVERYFLLMYKWKMNKSEIARKNLSLYTAREQLISEYEVIDEKTGESVQMDRVLNRIVFNAHFIEQLLCRSLFEVDWNSVKSISRRSLNLIAYRTRR